MLIYSDDHLNLFNNSNLFIKLIIGAKEIYHPVRSAHTVSTHVEAWSVQRVSNAAGVVSPWVSLFLFAKLNCLISCTSLNSNTSGPSGCMLHIFNKSDIERLQVLLRVILLWAEQRYTQVTQNSMALPSYIPEWLDVLWENSMVISQNLSCQAQIAA